MTLNIQFCFGSSYMPWSEVTDICRLAMLDVRGQWSRVGKNRQNGYKMLHCCWECIMAPLSSKFHFLLPFELLYPWETSVSIFKDIIFTLRIGLCLYLKLPYLGLPWWLRRSSVCLQCGKPGFNPWVRKMIWRRKWQPTPVFLPGKSHGQRNLVGYSPWGPKELDTTERLHFHFYLKHHWGHCLPCLIRTNVLESLQLKPVGIWKHGTTCHCQGTRLGGRLCSLVCADGCHNQYKT